MLADLEKIDITNNVDEAFEIYFKYLLEKRKQLYGKRVRGRKS